MQRTNRRGFLRGGLGLAVAGALPALGAPLRAQAARTGLEHADLAAGVRLFVTGSGANSVAIDTSDGVVLVDGGSRAESRDLLRGVRADGRPVALLFNTHWHPEVTGSNETLGKSGTRIVAHENTRLWLQRPIVKVLENQTHEPLPKPAWPGESFRDSRRFDLGGTVLSCGTLFQAHTDGDIYVHLPAANLIVAGGTVAVGRYPVLDTFTGGWIRGMLNATKTLIDLSDEHTRIVPETGPVVRRDHLQAQAEMLETLTERLWQMMRKGMSEEDLVAARPTQDYDARWGDPREFILNTYRGIWGHVREMRGIV